MHCFAEDALGSLDAIGVAEAIRAGLVSPDEVLDAASPFPRITDIGSAAARAY